MLRCRSPRVEFPARASGKFRRSRPMEPRATERELESGAANCEAAAAVSKLAF